MKVICEKCETVFKAEVIKEMKCCPVCGEPFEEDPDATQTDPKEKKTYYYYNLGGGTLTITLYDDETPVYTFEATDIEDARRQLKEVMPDSALLSDHTAPETRCPYCRSREIQLVPKKFSLLTGFATNRFDRVCVHCKKRF